MQLKYSNYVALSHFHGKAVNNSGYILLKDDGKQKLTVSNVADKMQNL